MRCGRAHAIRRAASGEGVFGGPFGPRAFSSAFKPLCRIWATVRSRREVYTGRLEVADDSKATDVGARYARAACTYAAAGARGT